MKTFKKILCVLIGGPILIAGFAGLVGDSQKVGGSKLGFLIMMVLGAFLIYLGFFKKSKNTSDQVVDCNIQLDLNHVNGLPVAENVPCKLSYSSSGILVATSGINFELSEKKINDITVQTDMEISKQYVSSIGGSVGGALLFGPVGAVIGGRAKQKKSKNVTNYLIITYTDNNEIKYLGFEINKNLKYKADKIVTDFKVRHQSSASTLQL